MSQISRLIAIPAAGGVPVVIRCTMVTEAMTIQEDGSMNNGFQQGLIYSQLTSTGALGPNAWTVGPALTVPPNLGLEPIIFQQKRNDHSPDRSPIGNGGSAPYPVGPGGPVTHGTPICQITSAGLATKIIVTEE